ncbi:MAG: polyprenyl synthetase family protein [Clostridia bacterium]|nr:polyprenyl synthetase family protein [Clostridia bacterium]
MIKELIKTNAEIVEKSLRKYMEIDGYGIEKSMSYSLLGGGKRIRPFIAIEVYKLFSKSENIDPIVPYACALEMIHTYSLIHDDLPAMDNDDYRRGKLTNHKVFGEAQALLAGDSLLTYAFKVASDNPYVSDRSVRLAVGCLADCSGYAGMAGGQMIDLDSANNISSYNELKQMHALKTGNLIKCACLLGYYASCDTPNKEIVNALTDFAISLGIAFQLRDDILDRISDTNTLGKPVGSDEKNNKNTSLSYMTIDEAQNEVDYYTNKSIEAIIKFCDEDTVLIDFAKYLINREK